MGDKNEKLTKKYFSSLCSRSFKECFICDCIFDEIT